MHLQPAADFEVTIDTTPLVGRAGYLALGDVSGSLAGTLTLRSCVLFSEFLQAMVFSPGLTRLSLSLGEATIAGGIPDTFSVFLLDTTLAPFASSAPLVH